MHSLIVGQTESGKSTLGKLLAAQLVAQGKVVAVYDPIFDPDWQATLKTDDIDELRKFLDENRSVYVFVDESGELFNEGLDKTHAWLATRSRHYGHSVFFLSQRATQIPKTMRDQCGKLFLFTSSRDDGIVHSEEWNKDGLRRCNALAQMHFYACTRFGELVEMEIVDYSDIRLVAVVTSETEEKPRKSRGRA